MSDADQINGSTKKLLDKLDRNAHAAALKVLKSCFSDLVSNASVKDEKDAANKKTADELLFHMTVRNILPHFLSYMILIRVGGGHRSCQHQSEPAIRGQA